MIVRFVYKCQGCGWSTVSDSPDLITCPIPWTLQKDGSKISTLEGGTPCGTEYEDGPMLDWSLLPNDVQLAIRDLLRPS